MQHAKQNTAAATAGNRKFVAPFDDLPTLPKAREEFDRAFAKTRNRV